MSFLSSCECDAPPIRMKRHTMFWNCAPELLNILNFRGLRPWTPYIYKFICLYAIYAYMLIYRIYMLYYIYIYIIFLILRHSTPFWKFWILRKCTPLIFTFFYNFTEYFWKITLKCRVLPNSKISFRPSKNGPQNIWRTPQPKAMVYFWYYRYNICEWIVNCDPLAAAPFWLQWIERVYDGAN